MPAPVEIVEMFDDSTPLPELLDRWGPPVFTPQEIEAVRACSRMLDEACERVPALPSLLDEAMQLPEWELLRREAEVALRVFGRRGKLPDDEAAAP